MPDIPSRHVDPTASWQDAFAALPLENVPGDGWSRIAARLPVRRPRRWLKPLAIAATLLVAIALPWQLHRSADAPSIDTTTQPIVATTSTPAPGTPLERLQAESARMEALLDYMRDDRVASASAAMLSADMDARIATIDAALRQPGLSPERQLWLWRSRVDALRTQTGFESTRRWLAASGEHYDGALARVD